MKLWEGGSCAPRSQRETPIADEWTSCPKAVWLKPSRLRKREIIEAQSGFVRLFVLWRGFRITAGYSPYFLNQNSACAIPSIP
jgi:hypothetical protein